MKSSRPNPFASRSGIERQEHRKPEYLVKESDGTTRWVYCPICLSAKNGHYSNGTPKYSGGLVPVRNRERECKLTETRFDATAVAACTCSAGAKYREYHGVAEYTDFPPDCRWPAGGEPGIEVVRAGGKGGQA